MDTNLVSKNSNFNVYGLIDDDNSGVNGFRFFDISTQYKPTSEIHGHNFWELCFIYEADAMHRLDLDCYNLTNNSVLFIKPFQRHQLTNVKKLTGAFLMFDEQFLQCMFKRPFLYQLFCSNSYRFLPLTQVICSHVNLIREGLKHKNKMTQDIIAVNVKAILLHLESMLTHHSLKGLPAIVKQFFYFLDFVTPEHRFVKNIAAKCHVSPNYLNELVKEHTKKSVKQWINQRVVLESKRLLKFTNTSVYEISIQLGFLDSANFCRFFRKQTGLSPLQWKKQDTQ